MYTNVEAVCVLNFSAIFVNSYTKFPLYWVLVKKNKEKDFILITSCFTFSKNYK